MCLAKTGAYHFAIVSSNHVTHCSTSNHPRHPSVRNYFVVDRWWARRSHSFDHSKYVSIGVYAFAAWLWRSSGHTDVALDLFSGLGADATLQKGRSAVNLK